MELWQDFLGHCTDLDIYMTLTFIVKLLKLAKIGISLLVMVRNGHNWLILGQKNFFDKANIFIALDMALTLIWPWLSWWKSGIQRCLLPKMAYTCIEPGKPFNFYAAQLLIFQILNKKYNYYIFLTIVLKNIMVNSSYLLLLLLLFLVFKRIMLIKWQFFNYYKNNRFFAEGWL